jgi:hypothetical protein
MHGTRQRPDIILHIPTEVSRAAVNENNYAVWALKLQANQSKAKEDYSKLNEMFSVLNYQNGFFINIDSEHHFLDVIAHNCKNFCNEVYYTFRERVAAFAVQRSASDVSVKVAYWDDNEITENLS